MSQSILIAFRSSQSEALWNPGMTLCSRVLVWTMESIRSSLVLSLATDGDLRTIRWLWWSPWPPPTEWPLRPRAPDGSSRKLSRIMLRTGATFSLYLNSSILDGERLMLLLYGGRDLNNYRLFNWISRMMHFQYWPRWAAAEAVATVNFVMVGNTVGTAVCIRGRPRNRLHCVRWQWRPISGRGVDTFWTASGISSHWWEVDRGGPAVPVVGVVEADVWVPVAAHPPIGRAHWWWWSIYGRVHLWWS